MPVLQGHRRHPRLATQRVSDGMTGDASGALCVQDAGTIGLGNLSCPAVLPVGDILMDFMVKNSGSS